MAEPRMPATVPSRVDRGEFRFVAVDADGTTWHWIDEEMTWARQRTVARRDDAASSAGPPPERGAAAKRVERGRSVRDGGKRRG